MKHTTFYFGSFLGILSLLSGSSFAGSETPKHTEKHTDKHWSYSGETSPKHWGKLKEEYSLCTKGKTQSPMDLTSMVQGPPDPISFQYYPSKVEIENNGHTVQFNIQGKSSIRVGGEKYDLLQFHFHIPSEHAFLGKLSDLEVHLVHKSSSGQLAVVGILIQKGVEQDWLSKFWDLIPSKKGEKAQGKENLNPRLWIPENKDYYSYDGSLTTPPCSEGVHWMVLKEQITLSEQQISRLRALYPNNSRPIQKPNGRKILYRAGLF
jgi:carbonic anhydrase